MTKPASQNRVPEVFSKATRALLANAGWTPTYHGPVDLYVAAFRDEELELAEAAKRFLNHFGGLVIPYKTRTRQDDVLEFRAELAARGSGHGTLAGYEEMAQEHPLCPIGTYSFGMCMLLMDGQGRVFGGTEWSLVFVGTTAEEAIERILTGALVETIAANVVDEADQPRREKHNRRK